MATGSVISQAGPGGAILAYILIGIMLYFLMSSIGELATFYPVSGSFSSYSTRFVDSSLGFTMGWLYWGMGTCNKCRYHCCFQCITILGCI